MKYFCTMCISLFLFTGCSASPWFSFPSKFTFCDVDVSYDTEKYNKTYAIVAAFGWCPPAKFLRKKKKYND